MSQKRSQVQVQHALHACCACCEALYCECCTVSSPSALKAGMSSPTVQASIGEAKLFNVPQMCWCAVRAANLRPQQTLARQSLQAVLYVSDVLLCIQFIAVQYCCYKAMKFFYQLKHQSTSRRSNREIYITKSLCTVSWHHLGRATHTMN